MANVTVNLSRPLGLDIHSSSLPVNSSVDGAGTGGSHAACQLLSSSFGWWLQLILGGVCFISLVGKRFTDSVRRPWKVWFFDTSKQVISAFMVHFVNILLSMAFGEWLSADADPCNWYWINLTLDDTLGVGILFVLLRLLQCAYRTRCVGRPELAMTGEYGDPPDVQIFGRQLLDWQALVFVQKCMLATLVVNFTSAVAAVAEALLGWLDPHPRVKLVVVMVVTPLTMNVFALWVADNFLQGDSLKSAEAQARESLVCGTPSVLGRRGLSPARLADEELSGDESERVMTFQDWKRWKAARGQQRSLSMCIPGLEQARRAAT
mmetsp:Transcript_81403/g.263647  ORF Transcript_81403/g.263647 Transcript_81403/m.263647 type:complete len:321 (+) Transcript_81403:114-1076(+)